MSALRHLAASAALLAACDAGDPAPAPDNALFEQVKADGYRDWTRGPGRDTRTPTAAPHGNQVEIFINDTVVAALANEDGLGLTEWPEGSVVVLEGYDNEVTADLDQIAIVEKRHGTWYWEQYQVEDLDRPRFSGRPDVCVGCHDTGQDFMRSFSLPKPVEED